MRIPLAIVVAGVLIAGAILFAFRWQISATPGIVYRLDTWTGRIVRCDLSIVGRADCQAIPFAK